MPLPRFGRLAPDRQAAILGVARAHFAAEGPETASYNKIIEASGISKSAVYQYFDGREDLLGAVLAGVRDRLLTALGPWREAHDPQEFWEQLARGARGLREHLVAHPDDLALVPAATTRAGAEADPWFEAVLADGRRLGVIRADVDPDLLLAATVAVFRAADGWAVQALQEGRPVDLDRQPWTLLAGLWGSPLPPGITP
ncbi:TetR/AcrR family transcriptional regulator [Actinotalea sp. K2]|uniref:TetR/AcrR family transcriptional regulator n=1 Tax=Actinotalea sp. K2 TaxID=2939438 RepID=UPI002016A926|nr:TetR/AcrR family transcriptional regulator [Actinotalea sp. K2]MCL3861007.1 TetR/AcrR family transcriptional regulator [Actinotalea sp. K2]